MVKILQKECDRQSRKVVEQFRNKRDFDQRVSGNQDICYKFLFIKVFISRDKILDDHNSRYLHKTFVVGTH